MKKIIVLAVWFLLIGNNVYAANGDLIVNGNVGVGTSTPNSKLHVKGIIRSENAAGYYMDIYSYNGATFSFGYGLRQVNDAAHSGYDMLFNNWSDAGYGGGWTFANTYGNAGVVRITNAGNVGIGIRSPFSLLTVYGTGSYASNNGGQIIVSGASSSKRLNVGYDTTNDFGFLQAVENNVAQRNLILEPNGGNVGIGTTAPGSYKLYVAGTAYSTGGWSPSDARFKKNLQPISDPLNKVLNMQGVSYQWKTDEYCDKGFPEGRHYGVIAQEIEKVLPEVVSTGPDGTKAVAYSELIPVLIEAIKEQQKEIEQLKERLQRLE